MPVRQRWEITAADAGLPLFNPLANVAAIAGVRVDDVGQGDAIALLDHQLRPVVRIDYGGRVSSPFGHLAKAARGPAIDAALPLEDGRFVLLTHWDEDHWYSADNDVHVRSAANWLTPRQMTSARAVTFSLGVENIRCLPEDMVGDAICFEALNGDELWLEKIGPFVKGAQDEDCNKTGLAFSIVRNGRNGEKGQVIFLPGDAPYHHVEHYGLHDPDKLVMRGAVAFHHGAGAHWTKETHAFLHLWCEPDLDQRIVFSCGEKNSYDHPDWKTYRKFLPRSRFVSTTDLRGQGRTCFDMLFW